MKKIELKLIKILPHFTDLFDRCFIKFKHFAHILNTGRYTLLLIYVL